MAGEHLELIEQRRPQDRLLRVGDLLLVVLERARRARQRRAADATVLVALVLVVRADRERVPVADLPREAEVDSCLAVLVRQVVLNDARRSERVDEGLLVQDLVVRRQRERRLAAAAERAAEEALVDLPLLGRLDRREGVARVDRRVAENDRGLTVELLRAWLGEDFDPPAAGARVLGRVGILVDPDLLHLRRADVQRADLHAVDDDGDAAVADRSGVQKLRHGGDEIVVEHRQALEHVLVDGDRVDVVARRGADLGHGIADGDLLGEISEAQHQALRTGGARADAQLRRCRLEPLVRGAKLVGAGRDPLETERSRPVRDRGLHHRTGGVHERHGRRRQYGAGLVLNNAAHRDR